MPNQNQYFLSMEANLNNVIDAGVASNDLLKVFYFWIREENFTDLLSEIFETNNKVIWSYDRVAMLGFANNQKIKANGLSKYLEDGIKWLDGRSIKIEGTYIAPVTDTVSLLGISLPLLDVNLDDEIKRSHRAWIDSVVSESEKLTNISESQKAIIRVIKQILGIDCNKLSPLNIPFRSLSILPPLSDEESIIEYDLFYDGKLVGINVDPDEAIITKKSWEIINGKYLTLFNRVNLKEKQESSFFSDLYSLNWVWNTSTVEQKITFFLSIFAILSTVFYIGIQSTKTTFIREYFDLPDINKIENEYLDYKNESELLISKLNIQIKDLGNKANSDAKTVKIINNAPEIKKDSSEKKTLQQ